MSRYKITRAILIGLALSALISPTAMADDLSPMTFCTADSEFGSSPASNSCDQDITTFWFSAGSAYPHWLELAGLNATDGFACVSSISIAFPTSERMSEWRIEAWDGTEWIVLRTETLDTQVSDMHTYDFEPFSASNFRIFGVAGVSSNFMGIAEVNVNECNVVTVAPPGDVIDSTFWILLSFMVIFFIIGVRFPVAWLIVFIAGVFVTLSLVAESENDPVVSILAGALLIFLLLATFGRLRSGGDV